MTNHEWPDIVNARAALGQPGDVRISEVFAPNAMALAITAHISRLSIQTGMGRKFTLSPKWWRRISENAQEMQDRFDEL